MVGTEGFGGLLADSNVFQQNRVTWGNASLDSRCAKFFWHCDSSSVTLSQADDIKPFFPCETSGGCLVELSRRNSKSAMARVGGHA